MSRIWFAIALAVALGAVAIVVVSTSGGEEADPVAAAPAACLQGWNRDAIAREAGRHNRTFHRYEEAQAGYLSPEGRIVADEGAGACAVVFPRDALDPEPEYAGFTLSGGRWVAMGESVEPAQLAVLQATALTAANAELTAEGELVAP